MEWKNAQVNDDGMIKVPERWLHLHYYEALNILFRFENSLRVFVYSVLKNDSFSDWKGTSFSIGDSDPISISSVARRRISQAANFGYLGYDIDAPLMHLTSGELVELICAEAHWPKFSNYFRGQKDIIKNKLLEVGAIRNALAHFRPLKSDDIELVKQNIRHTLMGVEACLQGVFKQPNRVPTNTGDEWYKSLSVLGTELSQTALHYSENELWVNVQVTFRCVQLSKHPLGNDFFTYKVANINTPKFLSEHEKLAHYITHISESINYPSLTDSHDIIVNKVINLVFRRDVLVANHEVVSEQLRDLFSRITEECDLLSQDNLARGRLVEASFATAYFSQSGDTRRWQYNYKELYINYISRHPDEYWGQSQYTTDIVGGSRRYPWMPADVSEKEGFFS